MVDNKQETMTMPDIIPYNILHLESDSPEVIEQLGSKRKFWFRLPDDEQPWLFKYTRTNTGEDWSEKIAAEIALLLQIPAAKVELATFMGSRGCASRSFVDTHKGYELIHGSEILAGRVIGYERTKQWGQSEHCVKNIISAVEQVFPQQRRQSEQLRILASYMVLDALICNTDRHHDNWGLLRHVYHGRTIHAIAPSFDHASSLGRELLPEKVASYLQRPNGIEQYIAKGRGGIFWDVSGTKGENPLLLAIRSADKYPQYFKPCIRRLKDIPDADILRIIDRVPVEWMSTHERIFCAEMLKTTAHKLRELSL